MSMTVELNASRRRCTICLSDTISLWDLHAGVRSQVDANAWTWQTLIDTTAATGVAATRDDVQGMVQVIEDETGARNLPPRGPVVIVVADRNSRIYELARLYQVTAMRTLGLRVEIVRQPDDADRAFERLDTTAESSHSETSESR
jgi:hypothetical protein